MLVVLCLLSLAVGAQSVSLRTVLHAITDYHPAATDQLVVIGLRLPRTVIGLLAGPRSVWPAA